MTVQAGIYNRDHAPVDQACLNEIGKSLDLYCCDDQTAYSDGPLAMLFRPLWTTAEARRERQPLVTIHGNILTWDGRLDNRHQLITQLEEYLTGDVTDIALVAAAFERWDTDCFSRFIGDWATCIWDSRRKELVLARDYIGVRHLFYRITATRVAWSTHIAPLLSCRQKFSLCNEYIAGYLASYPEADLTPYTEIKSVLPGHFVKLSGEHLNTQTYSNLPSREIRYKNDCEYEEHYRQLLYNAVRRRLRTDSPVLAELSGGLDSSSVVCIADSLLRSEGADAPKIDTFSYYDSNEPGEDDFAHIRIVEARRGRTGYRVDLKGSGDSIPLEYPGLSATPGFSSRTEIKLAMAAVAATGEYRVMLSGTGGDEINGQTIHPRVICADLLMHLRLLGLNKQLVSWSLLMRQPWIRLAAETLIHLMPLALRSKLLEYGRLEPWVDKRFASEYSLSSRQTTILNSPLFFNMRLRYHTHNLAFLGRQMSCATPSGIERRYPYLDQTLVEFLARIPLNQLLRPGQQRSLMRRALSQMVPQEVISRKTKASSARCYSVSLQKHWERIELILSNPMITTLGYVDNVKLLAALRVMRNGQIPPHFLRLLKAVFLELWLQDIQQRGVIAIEAPAAALKETLAKRSEQQIQSS